MSGNISEISTPFLEQISGGVVAGLLVVNGHERGLDACDTFVAQHERKMSFQLF